MKGRFPRLSGPNWGKYFWDPAYSIRWSWAVLLTFLTVEMRWSWWNLQGPTLPRLGIRHSASFTVKPSGFQTLVHDWFSSLKRLWVQGELGSGALVLSWRLDAGVWFPGTISHALVWTYGSCYLGSRGYKTDCGLWCTAANCGNLIIVRTEQRQGEKAKVNKGWRIISKGWKAGFAYGKTHFHPLHVWP